MALAPVGFVGPYFNNNRFITTMSRVVSNKIQNRYIELGVGVGILLVLLLTSINISNYLYPEKVLGVSSRDTLGKNLSDETKFWEDFLIDNPEYIPGWVELGRLDKVEKIDPNYFLVNTITP